MSKEVEGRIFVRQNNNYPAHTLRTRREMYGWGIVVCACALEPVPCIALCDSGTGFLFCYFDEGGLKNEVKKSCKIN